MLRDTRKNADYFERYLSKNESDIADEKQFKDSLPAENVEGKKHMEHVLSGRYMDRITAMYSFGCPLDEIQPFFSPYINCFGASVSASTGMFKIGDTFSLAVLFDMCEYVESLKSILEQTKRQDILSDVLLHNLDESWPITAEKTIFKWFPDFLKLSEEERPGYLQNFLQKHWYQQHRDAGWYDSHKSKYEIYSGYWAFDVAAVAKVFHVPDSPKWKYYPYDLAHYKRDE